MRHGKRGSCELPGILETVGEVESTDPVTGETIRLTVTADQIVQVEPPSAVTSVFVPGRTATQTDSGEPPIGADSEVCTSMLFFTSRENAESALKRYPNIAIFTIEEAFNLAFSTSTKLIRAPPRTSRRPIAALYPTSSRPGSRTGTRRMINPRHPLHRVPSCRDTRDFTSTNGGAANTKNGNARRADARTHELCRNGHRRSRRTRCGAGTARPAGANR
ncbi:MAG: organomercurial lyase [Acidimicrobiia bacterium]